MAPRRFPPPLSVEEQSACFVVRDHNGQQLAYVYFEDEPDRLQSFAISTVFRGPSEKVRPRWLYIRAQRGRPDSGKVKREWRQAAFL